MFQKKIELTCYGDSGHVISGFHMN